MRTDRLDQATFLSTVMVFPDGSIASGRKPSVLPIGNAWGFGQVIAIILLLLPFISFFEVVYGGTTLSEESLAIVKRRRY